MKATRKEKTGITQTVRDEESALAWPVLREASEKQAVRTTPAAQLPAGGRDEDQCSDFSPVVLPTTMELARPDPLSRATR